MTDTRHRNTPLWQAAYIPDVPALLPSYKVVEEGEDGLTIDERWREQWSPSPVWQNLVSNSPPVCQSLHWVTMVVTFISITSF